MGVRQIVLDTETTGLSWKEGHRIIEVGCVELVDRRLTGNHFHEYLNPKRAVDEGAVKVHGLTETFLADKPLFADISDALIQFIQGAELIIHNAPFDVGFLDYEFGLLVPQAKEVTSMCGVYDTLTVARKKYPGRKNSLDALCKRFEIDHFHRNLHGALLDAQILAQVYLSMTAGQSVMNLDFDEPQTANQGVRFSQSDPSSGVSVMQEMPFEKTSKTSLRVQLASEAEQSAHKAVLKEIAKVSAKPIDWF